MTFNSSVLAPFLKRGSFCDIYGEESSQLSLKREDGKLSRFIEGNSSGIGLRYIDKTKTIYGYLDCTAPCSQGVSSEELNDFSHLAKKLSHSLPQKRTIPRFIQKDITTHLVRINPKQVALDKKVQLVETVEKAARYHPSVRQVVVSYGERIKKIAYVNSKGDCFQEDRNYLVLSVQVTAEKNGILQTGYESLGGVVGYELFQETDPAILARLAAERAVKRLDSPSAPLGEMPVVISSKAGGTLIHEAIGHALEADGIQEGTSPHFSGKVGKVVANEKVSVIDDPTLSKKRGSFCFDDEGIPSERTVLVEKGVLKTYLYDRKSAKKDRRVSNGHGRRESYAYKPIPRMSNTFVAPGKDSPEEILKSLNKGLFVTQMGGGQVNTTTGDFVFEVGEGFLVEDGQVQRMIRGANLLGNGPEVLRSIDMVGNDMGWSIGTCGKEGQGVPVSDGLPTLRIPKLVIGGTNS